MIQGFYRRTIPPIAALTRLAWQAHSGYFSALIGLDLLLGLAPVLSAWIIKLIFDQLPFQLQQPLDSTFWPSLGWLLLAQIGLELAINAFSPLKTLLMGELQRRLELNVQTTIYQKINQLTGLAPFEAPDFQDLLRFAQQGAQQGPSQILQTLTTLQGNIISLVSFLGVLLIFSPLLMLLVVASIIPQAYIQYQLGQRRYHLALDNSPKERLATYYGHVLSSVGFAKELRLFNLGDYFLKAFRTTTCMVQAGQRQQQLHELRGTLASNTLSTIIARVAFVLVVLAAFKGQISLGDITLYTSVVVNLQNALSGLAFAITSLNETMLFFARFQELMALPQPIKRSSAPRAVPALQHAIEFRNVSFRYSEQHPWVLRQLNLTIPAHQSVALVGVNGAGKSTLVKLLTRLYDPSEGEIFWDGIAYSQLDPDQLRQRIGVIFQDFVRYDLTASQNIGLGNISQIDNQAQIRQAAQQAGVDQTLEQLPQGYSTTLSRWLGSGELGVDLSGGQWQKVALARMFMRQADLLILDEPSAALDAEAEFEIYNRFFELMHNRTSFLISHRFNTVRKADLIVVLENGAISASGSHHELYDQGSTYSKLYDLQAQQYQFNIVS